MLHPTQSLLRAVLRMFAILCLGLTSAVIATEAKKSFDLPAGDAEKTLKLFTEQSGEQILYPPTKVNGIQTNAVRGEMTPGDALDAMLLKTKLIAVRDSKTGATTIRREATVEAAEKNASRAIAETSDRPTRKSETTETKDGTLVLDTFEVFGRKTLNMDKPRSRDDAQPYVIFGRTTIEQSGAINLEDFLNRRLTMNVPGAANSQGASSFGNLSTVNLRGLGSAQTLILVDGHRTARAASGTLDQSDVNGIPLAAIERIEVLPTTASGIYGGSATGGVINIILRRDYVGGEVKATYENTFASDAMVRRVDFSTGVSLEDGKTNVRIAGSYSSANALYARDRDFVQRGRAELLVNNPAGLNVSGIIPPLGATLNILSAGGTPLFGPGTATYTSVPAGYAGGGGLAPLQANAGKFNLDLSDSGQSFGGGTTSLVSAPTSSALNATLRRQFSPKLNGFLELSASNNVSAFNAGGVLGFYTIPASAPNNPFGQSVRVRVPLNTADQVIQVAYRDRRAVGGVIVQLPGEWQAQVDYTWDRSRYSGRLTSLTTGAESTAITTGTIDVFRDTRLNPIDLKPYQLPPIQVRPADSTLQDAVLRMAGPLVQLSAGSLTLNALVENSRENFSEYQQVNSPTQTIVTPARSREVDAAYLEAVGPLVGKANRRPGIEELEVQAAGRFDHYVSRGATNTVVAGSGAPVLHATNKVSSANPTLGLRYVPLAGVMFRASFGTGFLPPSLKQLTNNANLGTFTAIDPKRGNTATVVGLVTGGSPGLKPEKSQSWSAGLVLTPSFLRGLRLSVDYTRIEKTDNITTLTQQQIVDNEGIFPGRVVRGPLPAGDPFSAGPIISVDASAVNIAQAVVSAYDIALDYRRKLPGAGEFAFYAIATRTTEYETQLLPGQPLVNGLGIGVSQPQKWRGSLGATWTTVRWTFGWNTRYSDSYQVSTSPATILNQGNGGMVASQTYHDVFASYRFGAGQGGATRLHQHLLQNTELQAGIKNVCNTRPPYDANDLNFLTSALGDRRLAVYYCSVKRSF